MRGSFFASLGQIAKLSICMHACCCGELEAADAFHSLEVEYECKNMRLGLLLSSFAHRDGHSAVPVGEVLVKSSGVIGRF